MPYPNCQTFFDDCLPLLRPPPAGASAFEYILLGGLNDHPRQAAAWPSCCAVSRAIVNLIAYNPDRRGKISRRPSPQRCGAFPNLALELRHVAVMSASRGLDEKNAACGQLPAAGGGG